MFVGKRTKKLFKIGRFIDEDYPTIRKPAIKGLPGLGLSHNLIGSHDRPRRKQPQQADLGEAAEANACFHIHFFEPSPRDLVVNVPSVGESDPDIHVREKE